MTRPAFPRILSAAVALALLTATGYARAQTAQAPQSEPSGAPHDANGYRNNYTQLPRPSLLKWQWERWSQGLPKPPANGYRFPVDHPDVEWLKANRQENTLTWIGHSTALLQMHGVNILTDPIFSERASPVQFAGPKRKVPPGLALDELPHVDIVVISHNHYDHLDTASVERLNAQAGGPPLFLVPLGIRQWMNEHGVTNVRELDWWNVTHADGLDITFVPAQHWSARSLTDRSETLWGGWVIKTPEGSAAPFSFYFAGDTGYSKDFEDIGKHFGGFDLALIPIGAYAPRWFMQAQHVTPAEAVQIHRDVHAKRSIGVHWGTFELADDPLDEAPRLLAEATREAGMPPDEFTVLRHGQMLKLDRENAPPGHAQ